VILGKLGYNGLNSRHCTQAQVLRTALIEMKERIESDKKSQKAPNQ
jgi:hypothetical protein